MRTPLAVSKSLESRIHVMASWEYERLYDEDLVLARMSSSSTLITENGLSAFQHRRGKAARTCLLQR